MVNQKTSSIVYFWSVLFLQILAYWQAFHWYIKRVEFAPEEAASLLIIIGLLVFLAFEQLEKTKQHYHFSLWPLIIILIIYIALYPLLPSLFKAGLAIISLLLTLYLFTFGNNPPLAFWGMILLSLPVVPSLQFILGYPARLISASLTVPILQINGFAVSQQGTYLIFQEKMLQFDAPCSGVTMLWASLLLTFIYAFIQRFNFWQLSLALIICTLFTLIGNVFRASSLFLLEFYSDAQWQHEAVGVMAFILMAYFLILTLNILKK